jgi:hypothetical protein
MEDLDLTQTLNLNLHFASSAVISMHVEFEKPWSRKQQLGDNREKAASGVMRIRW